MAVMVRNAFNKLMKNGFLFANSHIEDGLDSNR